MGLAIGLLLGAILLFWLGTRHRKKVYADYEDDSQKYTATTTMTLIKQTKSETQRWEDKGDGNQELVTDICYLPTYEYTVNGDGETKTALFCVIPDSDKSYNFIIGAGTDQPDS